MDVFTTCTELHEQVTEQLSSGKSVGFVPTMGALHEGHMSLVDCSVSQNDVTVASIFVNPKQFTNTEDLRTYPRTIENDLDMLENAGCHMVFVPTVSEMYPEGEKATELYNFGELENVMEGVFRPGHFNGVAVIVKRLFDVVTPTRAYFGLKDFQQLTIIKSLVSQYDIPVEIVPCDIVREDDGLAMSSRNVRLQPAERKQATRISQTLFEAQKYIFKKTVNEVRKCVVHSINKEPLLSVEYFDIVNAETLQQIETWDETDTIVGCVAVNVGEVRLIDAVMFKNRK
ncbi:MAG: pantoate--beta-alanine ligase [Bacteroidales bacterium]